MTSDSQPRTHARLGDFRRGRAGELVLDPCRSSIACLAFCMSQIPLEADARALATAPDLDLPSIRPSVRPSVLFHFGTGPVQKVGNAAAADQWAYDGGGDGREGREGIPRGSELAMAGIASSFGKPSARCCIRREILADQVITTSSSYHNLRGVQRERHIFFREQPAFRLITGSLFVSRLRRDPR